MQELEDFNQTLIQDVMARSGASKDFNPAAFTERMCELLIEQAVMDSFDYVGYSKEHKGKMRLDAWSFQSDSGTLHLLVSEFKQEKEVATLTKTESGNLFTQLSRFLKRSLTPDFVHALEEAAPEFGAAYDILERDRKGDIEKVRLTIVTNRALSARVQSLADDEVGGYPCIYDIWDLTRLHRMESSGKAREDITISFTDSDSKGLPCLPAFTGARDCESYLLVMPGIMVADLYDRFGERLLEQNVRTFLQFRGKVNKGMRNTLQNEPDMFFAYNNGLSATAEAVTTSSDGHHLETVTNLQIVNGGQTTASVFQASRLKKETAELEKVYVQVKLSVIPSDVVEEVVPRISEYANTQNKVNAADFFSNHPFHLRIEGLSRRLWAPSPEGGIKETLWFYERARGQYANAQASLTPSKKREFLAVHPRCQMITKTDFAKFEHSFAGLPHMVSLGAQKNFAEFAAGIGTAWTKSDRHFNELYFKRVVAKGIIFRHLDRYIMKQPWYGGYKANIVTYSIAKLASLIAAQGRSIDLEGIWNAQDVSLPLRAQLLIIAAHVNDEIQRTPEGITNVTEWCKKEACWTHVENLDIPLAEDFSAELLTGGEASHREKQAGKTQTIQTGIQSQTYVFEKGAEHWVKLREWNTKQRIFSPKELQAIDAACAIPKKIPTEWQCKSLVRAEERAEEDGFFAK